MRPFLNKHTLQTLKSCTKPYTSQGHNKTIGTAHAVTLLGDNLCKKALLISLVWLLLPALCLAAIPPNRISGDLLSLDLNVYMAARPVTLIVVEKDFQRLRVLRHDGRIKVLAEYFAATGENYGPKRTEGDEKTPEGIYFITKKYTDKKITIFGNRAFHLNYPNIFDSNAGLDGNGIYIHGTNKDLRANSTNGCVTLNNSDLDSLATYFHVGRTPVIIVSSLQKLSSGKGVYPDLTGHNFKLAKELLVPTAEKNLSFDNLYLIRVGGQTVAAGSYRLDKRQNSHSFAATYLDVSQESGWFVADRIPALNQGPLEASQSIALAEKKENQHKPESLVLPSPFAPLQLGLTDSRIWQPSLKEDYANWYQDALQASFQVSINESPTSNTLSDNIIAQNTLSQEEQSSKKTSQTAVKQTNLAQNNTSPESNHLLFGALVLVACLGGSALLFLRSQRQTLSVDEVAEPTAPTPQQSSDCQSVSEAGRVTKLRQVVYTISEKIQLTQNKMQGEARLMDTQELQAKIVELEDSLENRQKEIDKLQTEKSALKLKGMGGMAGQVEELGLMQQALKVTEEQLAEAKEDLKELPVLQEAVVEKQSQIQQLLAEKATLKLQASGMLDQHDDDDQTDELQNQIANMQEALLQEEERRKTSEAESHAQITALQAEITSLQEKETDSTAQQHLEQEITDLRTQLTDLEAALQDERQNKPDPVILEPQQPGQQERIAELEELLKKSQQEVSSLQGQLESTQAQHQAGLQENTNHLQSQIDLLTAKLEKESTLRSQAEQETIDQHHESIDLRKELADLKGALTTLQTQVNEQESPAPELQIQEEEQPHPDQTDVAPIQTFKPEPPASPTPEAKPDLLMDQFVSPEPSAETAQQQQAPEPEPKTVPEPVPQAKPSAPVAQSSEPSILPDDIMQQWINS